MQFDKDCEICIRRPLEVRKYPEPRKQEIINWMKAMRRLWHNIRSASGEYPKSTEWIKRLGNDALLGVWGIMELGYSVETEIVKDEELLEVNELIKADSGSE